MPSCPQVRIGNSYDLNFAPKLTEPSISEVPNFPEFFTLTSDVRLRNF
jgi:hypothetical protein